jgi:hypothetical protein
MYEDLKLSKLPAGIAANSADGGGTVSVIVSDFATDADGEKFYNYLEMLNPYIDQLIEKGHRISHIDHCLVLIKKSGDAKVYIDSLEIIAEILYRKEAVKKGDLISKDDIGGVKSIKFTNVEIPDDQGIIFFFSIRWKRGIYFDLRPIHSDEKLENIGQRLGLYFDSLLFSEIHSIEDIVWEKLYPVGWFPFIALLGELFRELISRVKEGLPIEHQEQKILEYFDEKKLQSLTSRFQKYTVLQQHLAFIERGIERYLAGDYLSSISLVWPRVEGIIHQAFAHKKDDKFSYLLKVLEDKVSDEWLAPTIYLPARFKEYLLKYYFREKIEVSRHSIAHGFSDSNTYDKKRALLGILMFDQLTYYLQLNKTEAKES